jgi:predicted enzyme related to lactoylglutathione lyase/DNA-binding transcriptional ArsR family regulator
MQASVIIVEGPNRAASILKPIRRRILEHLRDPDSASGAAAAMGLPRQRVGYHVRQLEKQGLIRQVGERRKGGCVERLMQATARHYAIGPAALGALGPTPGQIADRFSGDYLVAVAAQTMRDVGMMQEKGRRADQRLATLTLEAQVRFASPSDQTAFARELASTLKRLVDKYDRRGAPRGERFRVVIGGYPSPHDEQGYVQFEWREKDDPERVGATVWEPFAHDTDYFDPSTKPFMLNFRVANLAALLDQLRKEGVQVDDKVEEYEYGKFGWIMDPEGNRVELWEPPA